MYSSTFKLRKKKKSYFLDLGEVRESAKVMINGRQAGWAWAYPYTLEIGDFLRKGKNTIEIEVANLMANRIRAMDRQGKEWKKYHEINFVNIDYKSFDAADRSVTPGGLKGPVTIYRY